MVILTGENLGKRQQDLNKQVFDAASRKADFEQVKKEPNLTDVDVIFKIDLASKYKNVDYILETLKCGDSLYISRALKCTWLYDDDEYSKFINTDYLHHHIFPFMSFKMKRKFLTTISMYLRDEDRSQSFYTYCIGVKSKEVAKKFLIFTSKSFKLKVIEESFDSILDEEEDFYNNFVGTSFALAKAIMERAAEYPRSRILYYLRYLISVSENEYLDLLEKYDSDNKVQNRFGLRISKQILKKHRNRYVEHPLLYMERLNKNLVTKYVNVNDAKLILTKALPADVEMFWRVNFCSKYDFLIKTIPREEKFHFVQNMFNKKYPNETFEMSKWFLDLDYYELMTVDQRESWALQHLESNTDIQGVGQNYLWYAFVNFDKAFPEIKKLILKTPELKNRYEVVAVLVRSVRKLKDMQTLLTYYYDRHINEPLFSKEQFIHSIIEHHNVFEFDNDCWAVFNKIMHSMKVYKLVDRCYNSRIMLMVVMYHIIHKIDLPEALIKYILENNMLWQYDREVLYKKIKKEVQDEVNQYIANVYIDEITKLKLSSDEAVDDDRKIESYVQRYINFLEQHKKTKDDCPPIIMEIVNNNWDIYQHNPFFRKKDDTLSEAVLMRQLKKDSNAIVEKLPEVRDKMTEDRFKEFKINNFLKKLKIYYTNDIAKQYFNIFMETLTETKLKNTRGICNVVYAIFQLADDQTKIDFMTKYAPIETVIAHGEIDDFILGIQEGICKSAGFSRPPVPLPNILKYIKGDYLRFCLPIFQSYQAKLPQPLLQEFVTSLLDAPVSAQKHALRLVFQCFSLEDLKKTVSNSWNKTKNVSLRYVLYQSLCNKMRYENETAQAELFEVLKKLTIELREDDHIDIFQRYMNDTKLPEILQRSYIKICWQTVSKFLDKTENYRLKTSVIENINRSMNVLDGDFVKEIVEEHVNYMLVEKNIRPKYDNNELEELINKKWNVVTTYIIYFASDTKFVHKIIDLIRLILLKCIEMWNTTNDDILIYRQFCFKFIDDLIGKTTEKSCADAIPIFETVTTVLKDNFPLKKIYRILWALNLTILGRKVKQEIKINYDSNRDVDLIELIKSAMFDYGVKVGNLVKEYVDKKSYFLTANDIIAYMINDNIDSIMFINIKSDCAGLYENLKDRYVHVARGLTEVQIMETYLLALCVMPRDSNYDDYEKLLNKIKDFENDEVQHSLYEKFVYNDFKRRKLDV